MPPRPLYVAIVVVGVALLTVPAYAERVRVDSDKYDGLSDTERIDRAVEDAGADARLVFGSRTYEYDGQKRIDHAVDWVGSQDERFDENETVINVTGRWEFAGAGDSSVRGIAIDGNRSFTGDLVTVVSGVDRITFDRCHFKGALHEPDSDAGIVLAIRGQAEEVEFLNGSLSDAHSTAPIEAQSRDGSTAGGWRVWPSLRGFNGSSAFDGDLTMRNVDIFDIGHEVKYQNGDEVWEQPNDGTLNPGGWDIDAWNRAGRTGDNKTTLDNVRFRSCPGTFVKISAYGGELDWRDIHIHIRRGEPVAGRPIRLQSHFGRGDGRQRHGIMRRTHIQVDRAEDLTHLGGGSAHHMLMSFSGTLPDESLRLTDTLIEIGVDDPDPGFLRNKAVFGYHRTTAPKHNLVIENTTVNAPGGIDYFFRTSSNALDDPERARSRPNQVTFRNNTDIGRVRHFYYAHPHVADCHENRVFTHHHLILEQANRFTNLEGDVDSVQPAIAEGNIWRFDGGPFDGCEHDLDEMYFFKIVEAD